MSKQAVHHLIQLTSLSRRCRKRCKWSQTSLFQKPFEKAVHSTDSWSLFCQDRARVSRADACSNDPDCAGREESNLHIFLYHFFKSCWTIWISECGVECVNPTELLKLYFARGSLHRHANLLEIVLRQHKRVTDTELYYPWKADLEVWVDRMHVWGSCSFSADVEVGIWVVNISGSSSLTGIWLTYFSNHKPLRLEVKSPLGLSHLASCEAAKLLKKDWWIAWSVCMPQVQLKSLPDLISVALHLMTLPKCKNYSYSPSKLVMLSMLSTHCFSFWNLGLRGHSDFRAPRLPLARTSKSDTRQVWLLSQKTQEAKETAKSRWSRFCNWCTDAENRKRFASMGAAGVLSYGVVSNLNYIPLFAYAWYVVAIRSKVSPIHQWPAFLSTYATLYIFNNMLRPIKLVVIGFVTPRVDSCFTWLVEKGLGRKRAILLVYVVLNLLAVILMALSVLAASCLAGVSVWWKSSTLLLLACPGYPVTYRRYSKPLEPKAAKPEKLKKHRKKRSNWRMLSAAFGHVWHRRRQRKGAESIVWSAEPVWHLLDFLIQTVVTFSNFRSHLKAWHWRCQPILFGHTICKVELHCRRAKSSKSCLRLGIRFAVWWQPPAPQHQDGAVPSHRISFGRQTHLRPTSDHG